ncbi:lysophospholipid acyltransferase family protein [Oscillatoria laete-virens NRMC-F 0139]|nr:lysophospholipid acyltransferase family protein [Oscillatoria laete-virens]MDL5054712.1 lysophospholipid acyltransferase family protein [Oscillatoria laete-virens NRMC-F 0139]
MKNWFYFFCLYTSYVFFKLFHRARFFRREKVPADGGLVICMNHASYYDPPLLAAAIRPRMTWFLARKTLWNNPFFGRLITALNSIPVDQDRPDMTSLKTMIKKLKADEAILLFPEGQRTLDGAFCPAQPGVGLIVAKSRKPVLPVRVFGSFEAWPRNGKIKLFSPISVVVGDPVDLNPMIDTWRGDERALYQAISEKIMEQIARIELP